MPRRISTIEKELAIRLRKQGKTYSEIRKRVDISKGTLSYISKSIPLSHRAQMRLRRVQLLHLVKARHAGVETLKKNQRKALDVMRERVSAGLRNVVRPEVLKIALAFLHLGEGAKWKSHRGLQLGSSDPLILLLYMKLLEQCYNIDKSSFHCYIAYRADQSLPRLIAYWAKTLGVSRQNFYKSKPDPRTIGRATKNKKYKGVCILSCAGSQIQQELELIPELLYKGLW